MIIRSAVTRDNIQARRNAITRLEMYKFMLKGDISNGARSASLGDALLSEVPHITAYIVENTLSGMVQKIDKAIEKLESLIEILSKGICPACQKAQRFHCDGCGACNFPAGEASVHRGECDMYATL